MAKFVNITGLKKLDIAFASLLAQGAPKAAIAGTRASLVVVGKAMRAAVNGSSVPEPGATRLKSEARRSIGNVVRKGGTSKIGKTTQPIAKVGFGVGKRAKARAKLIAKAQAAHGDRKGRGVGASVQDIHWFVLGTEERRQTTTGRSTGKMDPVFDDVTDQAMQSSGPAAAAAGAKKANAVLLKEAQKRGR